MFNNDNVIAPVLETYLVFIVLKLFKSSPSIKWAVKSLIDEAIEKGKHLIIFIHQALENTTDTETVNVRKSIYIEVLDYLKAKVDLSQCDVITFREFYQIHEPNDYNEFMETRHNIEMNYLLSK